jgi:glycosyltransferase involved in cell wall biosynthesis
MRIVMLTQHYPPLFGGIERHVRDLSRILVARGHSVRVVTLWQPGLSDYEEDHGVRIYRIRGAVHRAATVLFQNPERTFAPPFPDPEMVLAIRRLLADEPADIVHAHNWLVYGFLPIKQGSRARLVVTLHDYNLCCPKWTLIYKKDTFCSGPALAKCIDCTWDYYGVAKGVTTVVSNRLMTRLEQRVVDRFVPVSQAVASGSALEQRGVPYEIIPNFIPDERPVPTIDRDAYTAQLPAGEFLLFVGGLSLHKGVDVLLRAYAALPSSVTLPLVLIGYEVSGFSFASLPLPDNTLVLQHWPNEAVLAAWKRCTIALVPSNWPEPCPTVAMEAMEAGRPVIASRIGGLPDIVADGETGILVPPGDADALRQAIQHLVEHPHLRAQMGRLGQQKVAQFQARSVVTRLEDLYYELIEGTVATITR